MRALHASQLLEIREMGRGLPPVQRALLLLGAASPETPAERLAALPVGRRDARLLDLRAETLGPVLASETRCPSCGERLELELRTEELRGASSEGPPDPSESLTIRHQEYEVVFRLPTSRDLTDVEMGEGAETRLLDRCVVEARKEDGVVAPEALPDSVVAAVSKAMAEADPLAHVELTLDCPACAHEWSASFDPAAFFWAEIEAWAPRLLREVHVLASAYGWPERDILAMSAWRREQYLSLLGE